MNRIMGIAGVVAGILGMLVCFVSGVLRLAGMWQLGDFGTMTFFTVGLGLMVAACFLKLQVIGSVVSQ